MKAILTKTPSLGFVGIAILASCGSSNHFSGVGPSGGEGSSGAGGSNTDQDDSGAVFRNSSGNGGGGQFAHGQMDGSVPFTDPDSGGTVLTPQTIDQCTMGAPSGLSAASLQALLAGGSAGSLRYLYPYAQTVFPRGHSVRQSHMFVVLFQVQLVPTSHLAVPSIFPPLVHWQSYVSPWAITLPIIRAMPRSEVGRSPARVDRIVRHTEGPRFGSLIIRSPRFWTRCEITWASKILTSIWLFRSPDLLAGMIISSFQPASLGL